MKTTRLDAFSDGVFAIAITLLVLEIKVPAGQNLAQGLLNLWPSYIAYAVSFIVIGAIWINHHKMFERIAHVDQRLLLLNTFHLLFVAFLPFPTAVLAHAFQSGIGESVAAALYGGTLTVIGILVTTMWFYTVRHPSLLIRGLSPGEAKRIGMNYLVGPAGYFLATLAAFVNPWISIALFVGLNAFFLWPRRN
jgi:uncharacterized membrane protein